MTTILLIMIYIAFISLGLPDSILGAAWPTMHQSLKVPLSYAGILSMTISGGTIISSLMSGKVIGRFGTGKVTVASVFMTAVALIGFAYSRSFYVLVILTIPLGLGAGSIDSALNHFVASHYKAIHMSWLHCFWGVGATTGPLIMSAALSSQEGYSLGYMIIGGFQLFLGVLLIASIPLFGRVGGGREHVETVEEVNEDKEFSGMKGEAKVLGRKVRLGFMSNTTVLWTLLAFLLYCSIEMSTGLWGSSYLVQVKGVNPKTAASWIAMYYLGITVGRFINGLLTLVLNNKRILQLGSVFMLMGALTLMASWTNGMSLLGFLLIGLGCAPIFPTLIHDTPLKVSKTKSQSLMGVQMATAYVGSTFTPPLIGLITQQVGFDIFPILIFVIVIGMVVAVWRAESHLRRSI